MANPSSESERNPPSGEKDDARRSETNSFRRRAKIAACVLVVLPFIAFAIDRARHSGDVLSGVSVSGTSFSGLTRRAAESSARELGQRLEAAALQVRVGDRTTEIAPSALGFSVDVDKTVERVMAAGRNGGALSNFGFWLARMATPIALEAEASIDSARAEALIDVWEEELGSARPFSGGIATAGGAVAAVPPRAGKLIERSEALSRLKSALCKLPREPVELPLVEREPHVVPGAVEAAVARANRLVGGPVTLASEQPQATLTLSREDLARALRSREPTPSRPEVALYFDIGVIEEKLAPLREKVVREPENARFVIEKNDRVTIIPSKTGTLLRAEPVADALIEAAAAPARVGPLPILVGAEPEQRTADLEALRIGGVVGQYTTHHVCCQPRVENIHRIADLLDGKIVKPGEIISVNAEVGTRTPKNGFKAAPTIEEGEMVDALGGGVSQFATTFFNAIFLGGYDVIERVPHTYYFSRYPMGRDATLSWPKPDIIFKNDTESGMLIDTAYTDTSITVRIFGDSGGRKVTFEVSPQQNVEKPGIEYIPDITQTHEKDKVKEGGQLGWTVYVTRKIRFADGTTKAEKRKVIYKPRVRRVVVHPCRVPAGEPGHTGVACPVEDGGGVSQEEPRE